MEEVGVEEEEKRELSQHRSSRLSIQNAGGLHGKKK
jgi:hypothetical protein